MKYFQQTIDFDYSWEEVSTSNWQKYGPWNEKTPHVIAVDTISRAVDPATGIVSDSFRVRKARRLKSREAGQSASIGSMQLTRDSCEQSVSSPADSRRPNGYKASSVAKTRPWCMKRPTSIPSQRSSPSAP